MVSAAESPGRHRIAAEQVLAQLRRRCRRQRAGRGDVAALHRIGRGGGPSWSISSRVRCPAFRAKSSPVGEDGPAARAKRHLVAAAAAAGAPGTPIPGGPGGRGMEVEMEGAMSEWVRVRICNCNATSIDSSELLRTICKKTTSETTRVFAQV